MSGLDAAAILSVWEAGSGLRPLDRAVLMLWQGAAEADDIPSLPLAIRDRRLLQLRSATFGRHLDLCAACPQCEAELDISLDADELAASLAELGPEDVEVAGERVGVRSLTSHDLGALASVASESLALMIRRRLTGAETLSPALAQAVDARIEAREAGAELAISLTCEECDAAWREVLDVAALFWAEIAAAARRLMGEVAAIAAAYGWAEAEILDMSPLRRAGYLELARVPWA